MEFQNELVLLRPMVESDIPDRIRWEIVDNEWHNWGGPWDYEGKSGEELEAELNAAGCAALAITHSRACRGCAASPFGDLQE